MDFILADRLLELRTLYNYKQDDVSNALNISRQAYSNYETGKRLPDLETTAKLADFYGMTLDELCHPKLPLIIVETDGAYEMEQGHCITLNESDTQMLIDYKQLPASSQKEVRSFIKFKRQQNEERSDSGQNTEK